ncbi:MAG: aminoacyl-tRNA deacylase [Gaiellaceae bacterium]
MTVLSRALALESVDYEVIEHPRTETATAEAKVLGVPLDEVAKTVVLVTSGGHVRAVLPASERLDLARVRELLGDGKTVHLASEEELAHDYPMFELGAVPPLGGPRDPVLVDRHTAERESVIVEAGSHRESLLMKTADLVTVTDARVAEICEC